MCKVSVIIPVYNVEKYLSACLDSVLNQTLQDLEIICIDDCSPDRCGAILNAYAAGNRRIKVLHLSENHLQGYARNRGIEQAAGEYLYFLDPDDAIEPETLQELAGLADRQDLDCIFFDGRVVYDNEDLKTVYNPPLPLRKGIYQEAVYAGKELLDEFIRQNEWNCHPQRSFWRRTFIINEEIRFLEGCVHEDEYFAFAATLLAKRAGYLGKQYCILRVRPDSVMTTEAGPRNFYGYLMNYWYMNRFAAEHGIHTAGAERIIAAMYERIMTLYSKLKNDFDLSSSFVKEPDRTIYRCFTSMLRSKEINAVIDPEVLEEIRKHRIVYIYGVRQTGERFFEKLIQQNDILIGGFLAQYPEDVRPAFRGRPVCMLEDADLPADAIVVVATKMMFWEEIRTRMEERNIPCVFHRKL